MKITQKASLLWIVLSVSALGAQGQISSTFDTSTEGWGVQNDADGFQWEAGLGNPAGSISADDVGNGQYWYFAASDAYLGDRSSYFGGSINWDILGIRGNQTSTTGTRADVMFSGDGLLIGVNAGVQPVNGQWTSWQVALDTSSPWRVVSALGSGTMTNTVVTQAQLQGVLSDLTGVYIRGEYTNGSDSTALDNVSMIPAPASAAVLMMAVAAGNRRRRDD